MPSAGRGHSSVGRALEWHSRGQRFDPAWLHQSLFAEAKGLGHRNSVNNPAGFCVNKCRQGVGLPTLNTPTPNQPSLNQNLEYPCP